MSTALYRRYRPETFGEVIGQEHVTDPLRQALRNDRVHHAYLFSGPRGCGKTTSARILARCLNCAEGPTPDPCGKCDSCQALTRGGPGSIDVIEIDAASHGGVEDARDLRERAFLAPASSRYKIYIIDEAHMVSSAGFNALLKVVEEPPEHVKFVFATTEPEKVIGTIRSRTHHYPFRLVPPGRLQEYLAEVCGREGVTVDKGVLALVVRAGGGSVRDALSILDQLLAGAGPGGVTYALAVSLLGYIDATLLDDAVEALAAHDAAGVFGVVDRVIEGGADPRRFAEDLLERLRDLVILAAVPDASPSLFGDIPSEQLERMRQQGGRFGSAQLSRAADLVNAGLTEMRGATSPRLHLELLCARVLLPTADDDDRAVLTRLERLERRMALGDLVVPSSPAASARTPEAGPRTDAPAGQRPAGSAPAQREASAAGTSADRHAPAADAVAVNGWPAASAPASAETDGAAVHPPETSARPTTSGGPVASDPALAPAPTPGAGGLDIAAVRRAWPDVLEVVKQARRFTWSLLSHNASVVAIDRDRLTLGLVNAGARDRFLESGSDEILRQALITTLDHAWKVEAIVDPTRPDSSGPPSGRSGGPAPGGSGSGGPAPRGPAPDQSPGAASAGEDRGGNPSAGSGSSAVSSAPEPPAGPEDEADPAVGSARQRAVAAAAAAPAAGTAEDEPSLDDPDDPADSGLSGLELLQREMGARVIGEYDS